MRIRHTSALLVVLALLPALSLAQDETIDGRFIAGALDGKLVVSDAVDWSDASGFSSGLCAKASGTDDIAFSACATGGGSGNPVTGVANTLSGNSLTTTLTLTDTTTVSSTALALPHIVSISGNVFQNNLTITLGRAAGAGNLSSGSIALPAAGSTTWTGLSDTASSIVADECVMGNSAGTALEFGACGTGGGAFDLWDDVSRSETLLGGTDRFLFGDDSASGDPNTYITFSNLSNQVRPDWRDEGVSVSTSPQFINCAGAGITCTLNGSQVSIGVTATGDITAITTAATSGLNGGAASGDVTLVLDPSRLTNFGSTTLHRSDTLIVRDDSDTTTKRIALETLLTGIAGTGLTLASNGYQLNASAVGAFVDLSDTPAAITADECVKGNAGGTAVVFGACASTTGLTTSIMLWRAGTEAELSPIVTDGGANAAHGLGADPDGIEAYIECINASGCTGGWAMGDRARAWESSSITFGADGTTVYIGTDDAAINISPRGGGPAVAITLADWKAVAVPYVVEDTTITGLQGPAGPSGPGDIESVTAGIGLTGGGTTGAVTINLDIDELTRSSGVAANDVLAFADDSDPNDATESIVVSSFLGSISGTGLSASGNQLSIATAYRLPGTVNPGQIPNWSGTEWTAVNLPTPPANRLLPANPADDQFAQYNATTMLWEAVNAPSGGGASLSDDDPEDVETSGETEGTDTTASRSDHVHALASGITARLLPIANSVGQVPRWGGTTWGLTTVPTASNGTPFDVGTGGQSAGTNSNFSRSDHDHQLASVVTGRLLPTGCSADQIAEYSGSAWACIATPSGGGGSGDITGVTTATNSGLAGGATSGTVTLTLDADNLPDIPALAEQDELVLVDQSATNDPTNKISIGAFFQSIAGDNLTWDSVNDELDAVDGSGNAAITGNVIEDLYNNMDPSDTALTVASGSPNFARTIDLEFSRALTAADDDKDLRVRFHYNQVTNRRTVDFQLNAGEFRQWTEHTTTTGTSPLPVGNMRFSTVIGESGDNNLGAIWNRQGLVFRRGDSNGNHVMGMVLETGGGGTKLAVSNFRASVELVPRVDALMVSGGGSGAATFTDLTDTPDDITADQCVRGNSAGDALEFAACGTGGTADGVISGLTGAYASGVVTFTASRTVGTALSGNATIPVPASWALSSGASGTAPVARLGTGTANSTVFLRGDGQWAAPASSAGDITAVTAGLGLSGGGTSGAVTVGLDLDELSAATPVAADEIAFVDTGTANDPSHKVTITNFFQAFDGDNLSWDSTNGELDANVAAWARNTGASGQAPVARLGTGTPSADTQLYGDGAWRVHPASRVFLGSMASYDDSVPRLTVTAAGGVAALRYGDAVLVSIPAALATNCAATDALDLRVRYGTGASDHQTFGMVNSDGTDVICEELIGLRLVEAFRLNLGGTDVWELLAATDLTTTQVQSTTDTHFGLVSGQRIAMAVAPWARYSPSGITADDCLKGNASGDAIIFGACGSGGGGGDITAVTAGTGLSGGGDTGAVTLDVDLDELPTSTATMQGTDALVFVDESDPNDRSSLVSLANFAAHLANAATSFSANSDGRLTFSGIDAITTAAASGLAGGATSGTATLTLNLAGLPSGRTTITNTDRLAMIVDSLVDDPSYTITWTEVVDELGDDGRGINSDNAGVLELDFEELSVVATSATPALADAFAYYDASDTTYEASRYSVQEWLNDTAGVGLGRTSATASYELLLSELAIDNTYAATDELIFRDVSDTTDDSRITMQNFCNRLAAADTNMSCNTNAQLQYSATAFGGLEILDDGSSLGTGVLKLDFDGEVTVAVSGDTADIELPSVNDRAAETDITISDFFLMWDNSESADNKVTFTSLRSAILAGAGDITSVTAGAGLTGGGTIGDVTLAFDIDSLPGISTLDGSDTIPIEDETDSAQSHTSIDTLTEHFAGLANAGLDSNDSGRMILDVDDLTAVTDVASGDFLAVVDIAGPDADETDDDGHTRKITVANFVGATAGTGLDRDGENYRLDIDELTTQTSLQGTDEFAFADDSQTDNRSANATLATIAAHLAGGSSNLGTNSTGQLTLSNIGDILGITTNNTSGLSGGAASGTPSLKVNPRFMTTRTDLDDNDYVLMGTGNLTETPVKATVVNFTSWQPWGNGLEWNSSNNDVRLRFTSMAGTTAIADNDQFAVADISLADDTVERTTWLGLMNQATAGADMTTEQVTYAGQTNTTVIKIADNAVGADEFAHGTNGQVWMMSGGAPGWHDPFEFPTTKSGRNSIDDSTAAADTVIAATSTINRGTSTVTATATGTMRRTGSGTAFDCRVVFRMLHGLDGGRLLGRTTVIPTGTAGPVTFSPESGGIGEIEVEVSHASSPNGSAWPTSLVVETSTNGSGCQLDAGATLTLSTS